jgi:acetyltransferase-like isoleucine patch superfamily enzyme
VDTSNANQVRDTERTRSPSWNWKPGGEKYWTILKKAAKSPVAALNIARAFVVGLFYLIYYRIFTRNVIIRFPFFVYNSWVRITGPGAVHLQRNCHVLWNALQGLTIVTLSPNAEVKIGSDCQVGGATIRCMKSVEIGKSTFTSNCLIQDCLLVSDHSRSDQGLERAMPIVIGNNVWIGQYACVLGGSVLGDDCTVAYQSVCYKNELDHDSVGLGNPIKKGLPVIFLKGCKRD